MVFFVAVMVAIVGLLLFQSFLAGVSWDTRHHCTCWRGFLEVIRHPPPLVHSVTLCSKASYANGERRESSRVPTGHLWLDTPVCRPRPPGERWRRCKILAVAVAGTTTASDTC